MPFGLGLFEALFIFLATFAVPAGAVVLLVRALSRGSSPDRLRAAHEGQLAAELDAAHGRVEELEAKLARVEEKAAFDEDLLGEGRGKRQGHRRK